MKRSLSRAASAVGAAIVLSAAGFADPVLATEACWDTSRGTTCRDYGESATGLAKVRAAVHPTFAGILNAGQTLTSSPGLWLFGQGTETETLKYQWLRDGVAIPGAVDKTYKITASDDGRSLALRVTASAQGVNDGVETTLPSRKISAVNTAGYTARPGITGDVPTVWGRTRVGFTLEVSSLGTWSPGWTPVQLQWQADGADIEGATADTYTIKAADVDRVVTLKVTGSADGVPSVSLSNSATAVSPGYIEPTDEMWLAGGDRVGNTLHVERSQGWYAGGEPVTLLYQWERDGQAIPGASASTYTVVAADSGHRIQAEVTATAPGYLPNTRTSLYTDILDAGTGGNGDVDPGGQPVPEPAPVPAPIEQAPAAPAPGPDPAVPAPEPAPAEEAPVRQFPAVQPLAQQAPARNSGPVQAAGGNVHPQVPEARQAAATGAVGPAETGAAPAEPAPAVPATADPATAAAAGPSPSPSSSGPAATAQAAATPFNPLPVFFTVAGVLIAAGLVWVIRPLRVSARRIVGRKTP
ncbi:hypothetical protein [Arthrobacter sp. UYEF36]|uniref:hypothetical protein n=1 Tax=Arthrobacter sp. UYEF36 TaxID=1756366 RepID=UPI003391F451